MNSDESYDASICAEQMLLAERELAAFIGAVKELLGPEQARVSADDWLEEFDLMDRPSRYSSRDCRAVTVAASARLARRLALAPDHWAPGACADPSLSQTRSSDCCPSMHLV
jgi:hypothetical protein